MADTQDCFAYEYSGGDASTVAALENVARPTPIKGDPVTSHVSMQKLIRDHDEVNGTETTVTVVNKHSDADRPDTEVKFVLKPTPEVVAHLVYNSTDVYKRQEIVNQFASSCAAHTNWRIDREKNVLAAKKQQQEKQEEEKLAAAYAELQKKKEVRLSVQHYIDRGCHSGYTSGERFVIDGGRPACQPVGVPVCVSRQRPHQRLNCVKRSTSAFFRRNRCAHAIDARSGYASGERFVIDRAHTTLPACVCPCVCVSRQRPRQRPFILRRVRGAVRDRSRTHDPAACGCPSVCV